MSSPITGLCRDHSFESAEAICRRCGLEFCELCLVYPFGAKKPFCKECAMVAGGVRRQATRPEMGRRDVKARTKALAERLERTDGATAASPTEAPELTDPLAAADAEDGPPPPDLTAPVVEPEGPDREPSTVDWSRPFG